ncbi:hypothetical protein SCOCK_150074 [Actinacidiphila cocklensis]|uniref:Uncharacterized protein n=1 Tax=Actinacidiphila cocklensis TaxID=887465 RepID=A0A9W4E3K1_9ACTN|nr:hypothetical protein SCOCK_150074 [Actinacidiphila cocklensis]
MGFVLVIEWHIYPKWHQSLAFSGASGINLEAVWPRTRGCAETAQPAVRRVLFGTRRSTVTPSVPKTSSV